MDGVRTFYEYRMHPEVNEQQKQQQQQPRRKNNNDNILECIFYTLHLLALEQ